MRKNAVIHMRIEDKLKAQAEKAAKAENRTLTNWIESLIKREIANAKKSVER